MKPIRSLALGILLFGLALSVNAQATRTWVSGVGADENPCSRTAPCKTFAGAYSKTAANGEINCIDAGGYGTLTIAKGLTIECSNVEAGVLASGTSGFIINAGANDKIVLRGIDINGTGGAGAPAGNGTYGIRIINAAPALVLIDNVRIYYFNSRGISIDNSSGNANVVVHNTEIFNIANHAIACLPTGAATVNLVVDGLNAHNNSGVGIDVFTNSTATVRNSTFTKHIAAGILVEAASAEANVSDSTFASNGQGVQANAGTLGLFGCQIVKNTTNGINLAGGTVLSHQNNAIRGNTGNQAPTMGIGMQ